jgi:hypothetical protein
VTDNGVHGAECLGGAQHVCRTLVECVRA